MNHCVKSVLTVNVVQGTYLFKKVAPLSCLLTRQLLSVSAGQLVCSRSKSRLDVVVVFLRFLFHLVCMYVFQLLTCFIQENDGKRRCVRTSGSP